MLPLAAFSRHPARQLRYIQLRVTHALHILHVRYSQATCPTSVQVLDREGRLHPLQVLHVFYTNAGNIYPRTVYTPILTQSFAEHLLQRVTRVYTRSSSAAHRHRATRPWSGAWMSNEQRRLLARDTSSRIKGCIAGRARLSRWQLIARCNHWAGFPPSPLPAALPAKAGSHGTLGFRGGAAVRKTAAPPRSLAFLAARPHPSRVARRRVRRIGGQAPRTRLPRDRTSSAIAAGTDQPRADASWIASNARRGPAGSRDLRR
jgi:hypothetical protein